LAVSFYGSPRTTSDVDVMVALEGGGGEKLRVIEALQCAGLEVDEGKVDAALASGYNIATFEDGASPYSVDVIFSPDKLDKRSGRVAGLDTFLQLPEGLVLAKLRMVNYHPTSWVASCFIDQTRSPLTPGGASRWEGEGTEVTVSTRVVDLACPMPIEIRSLLKIFQPFGASSTRQDGWSSRHGWIKDMVFQSCRGCVIYACCSRDWDEAPDHKVGSDCAYC
jgi:hypothetical protein